MAVVLEERVNTKKVCYLLEHYTYEKFLTNWSGKKCDAKKEYTKIKNYLDTKAKDNNITRYNHIKGRKDGRLFGDGETIQTLPKNIRGFICEGITTDLDMDNCHPSILLRLCKEYNIECPNLNLYYNERKEKLKNIMEDDNVDYETAKLKVLVATNSNKKINTDCKFLKNYCKEMLTIQKSFLDISDFDYVKDYAKKDKDKIEADIRRRAKEFVRNLHNETKDFNAGKDTKTKKAAPVTIAPKKAPAAKKPAAAAKPTTKTVPVKAYCVKSHKRTIKVPAKK